MRKFFIFISVLILAATASATETTIGPGNPETVVDNILQSAITAATEGDVIILRDGIYNEDGNFDLNKNLTIQAADGQYPVIAQRYYFKLNMVTSVNFLQKGLIIYNMSKLKTKKS